MSRQLSIVIVIILFILLALGGYFLWWPIYQEFQQEKSALENKDKEIKEKEGYLAELKALSEKLSAYSDEVSKISSALPTEPSAAALFGFLQKISSENGLILTDIDLAGFFSPGTPGSSEAPEAPKEKIQKIPFSFSVSGSYSAFKNFLSALYKSSRIINVKTISFSSPEEGKELFDFSLELETHSYRREIPNSKHQIPNNNQ